MSAELTKELEKISIELEALKKLYIPKKITPEIKHMRYNALLNRISKCPEVDMTPDEFISSLKRKPLSRPFIKTRSGEKNGKLCTLKLRKSTRM